MHDPVFMALLWGGVSPGVFGSGYVNSYQGKTMAKDQLPEGSQFNPIQLPVGATAEPNTCGTCKFFNRGLEQDYGNDSGICTVTLPPWVMEKAPSGRNEDEWVNPRRMKDGQRCDLQHGTGKFYQISQVIGPSGKLA